LVLRRAKRNTAEQTEQQQLKNKQQTNYKLQTLQSPQLEHGGQ
jgi:hypothetical protein